MVQTCADTSFPWQSAGDEILGELLGARVAVVRVARHRFAHEGGELLRRFGRGLLDGGRRRGRHALYEVAVRPGGSAAPPRRRPSAGP
jgi:hypothetical protein